MCKKFDDNIRVTKVTDVKTQVVHHIYWLPCSKCGADVPVPEVYYAWNMRTFDCPPIVKCNMHGGDMEDKSDDVYASEWWQVGPAAVNDRPSSYRDSEDIDDWWDHDDSRSRRRTWPNNDYQTIGFHGHVYVDSFAEALKELKSFCVE